MADLQERIGDLLGGGDLAEDKELYFAVVRTIGTDLAILEQQVRDTLGAAGFELPKAVKLSDLLEKVDHNDDLEPGPTHVRYRSLMDLGDNFRTFALERTGLNHGVALLGVRDMATRRAREASQRDTIPGASDISEETPSRWRGRAYLILSLMHPDEVSLLRQIYRSQLFVIAASSSQETRLEELALRISRSTGNAIDECKAIAMDLINRDAGHELDAAGSSIGPHRDMERQLAASRSARVDVSRTYELADVFISPENREDSARTITRFLDLVFSHRFHTPTADELGMYTAYGFALRSGSLSRRVGAVICTREGEIVSAGTNDVPKYGGGLYWAERQPDERDHVRGFDPNDATKGEIVMDFLDRLSRRGWLRPEASEQPRELLGEMLADDVLNEARVLDVIEFGRAVHAEMAAISDAALRGISLKGTTLYCTTFPCHECARHIVASGIERVVYIEAYAKSRVAQLYRDSIGLAERNTELGKRVRFEPFVGIGPSRFNDLFSWVPRKRADVTKKKDLSGAAAGWNIATGEVRDTVISGVREYFQAQLVAVKFAESRSVDLVDQLVATYESEGGAERITPES